ncbi:hypothetical protein GALL_118580 [mine drainage metagenome]|uniref:Uncharacterized protein n=1 Tax=mine drainage metagenome TaxID=410659 RepID=A0A1J5SPT4_9ZZZZ
MDSLKNRSWHYVLPVFIWVALTTTQALASDLPIPSLTPGAIDLAITQENIQSTVCVKGYTKTIRPPASYTNKLKKRQLREYGYDDRNPKHYEEDHLIPLSIGGNPTDSGNLWPEPRLSEWNASKKDDLEFALYKMVCKNEISLKEAQAEIASDWIAAYKKYVHEGKGRRHGRKHGRVE